MNTERMVLGRGVGHGAERVFLAVQSLLLDLERHVAPLTLPNVTLIVTGGVQLTIAEVNAAAEALVVHLRDDCELQFESHIDPGFDGKLELVLATPSRPTLRTDEP